MTTASLTAYTDSDHGFTFGAMMSCNITSAHWVHEGGRRTDSEVRSIIEEAGGPHAVAIDLLREFGLPFLKYVPLSELVDEGGCLRLVFSDECLDVTISVIVGERGVEIRPVDDKVHAPTIRSTIIDLVRMCAGLLDVGAALVSGRVVIEGLVRGEVAIQNSFGILDHPIGPALKALLPRTVAVLKAGMHAGIYLGGQLFIDVRGNTLIDEAYGETAIGELMTANTIHRWFCAGKPITAIAVCQLWERNLLLLDNRVSDFFPSFAKLGKKSVTIRHLLTHTAGLASLGGAMAAYGFSDDTPCMARMLKKIIEAPLREGWIPGGRGAYDLIGAWYILGGIIEEVTGQDLPSYLLENIFEPLGMHATHVRMDESIYKGIRPRLGGFHIVEPTRIRSFLPRDGDRSYLECNPGTGLCGTASDLGRFYSGILRGIRADSTTQILRPQTLEVATASHRVGMKDEALHNELEFGLGFETCLSRRIECASTRAFGLTGFEGAVEGFADPELGIAIAAVFNGVFVNRRQKWTTVVDAIYKDLGLAR